MPKTKFQSVIFTALMAFCMVYCMTVYTITLNYGALSYQIFLMAIKEMWLEYIVVFCLIFFLITNTAKRLAFSIINPECTQPIYIILAIICYFAFFGTMYYFEKLTAKPKRRRRKNK